MYSGKKDNGGIDVHKGNRIFVFDWNGNPKKELLLPTLIDKFTISSDNNKIYFYNAKTNTIQKTNSLDNLIFHSLSQVLIDLFRALITICWECN